MSNTKPRVIGYIPLFYGKEYLSACIKSMEPFVERILIFYVDKPSQGHGTDLECPETEQELKEIAEAASPKVEWYKDFFGNEGEHRANIYKYSKGYDLVLTLDGDEVIDPNDAQNALDSAYASANRYHGIAGFINFWRSFSWVCTDGFTPVRIINLNNEEGEGVVPCKIYHFSCAQSEAIVRYKWAISGHKDELIPGWIDEVFYKWTPGCFMNDLHPVAHDIWNATPFDKSTLPDVLKTHPNYLKEII